jgi:3-oxoacyl-[acyl-carrier protein] reductase
VRQKTALITGGAKGIGRSIAFQLAEDGINVIVNYRNSQQEAIALANELSEKYGTRNWTLQGDISNLADCQRMVLEALAITSIDILIHNAGPYIYDRKKLTDYSFEEWNYLINGNLNGAFYLTKLLIPQMRSKGWGRIITFGFDRVESAPGWIFRSAFAAAKTGLASLTKTIAIEEAENGITSNMVCPGDIIKEWKECSIEDALTLKDVNSPVGRPGTGEDISRVVSFLVDEKSGFITGSIIPITGGKDVLGKVFREEV